MAQKKATAKKPTVKIVRKTKRTEAEDRKAAAIEKRKATLAKKAQIEEVENKYSVMAESLPQEWIMGADKVELLKTIHRDILGLTKKGDLRPLNDLRLYFIEAAQRGLNPFKNQIHAVYYYDKSIGAEKLTPITGIDGFIALAQRTKQYAGMSETRYEDFEEGHEYAGYPKKAVVDIYGYNPVTGAREIINTATAWWEEYVPLIDEKDDDGKPTGKKRINSVWAKRPRGQLEKCAQALGIRRVFPEQTGGLYTMQEVEHLRTAEPEDTTVSNDDDAKAKINEQLKKRRAKGKVFEGEVVEKEA